MRYSKNEMMLIEDGPFRGLQHPEELSLSFFDRWIKSGYLGCTSCCIIEAYNYRHSSVFPAWRRCDSPIPKPLVKQAT